MTGMKYLFWNTHQNENINSVLCDLIVENQISLVILAEYTAKIKGLTDLLNLRGFSIEQYPAPGCERIRILGIKGLAIKPADQADHFSIQVIDNNLILCCVHLNSQLHPGGTRRREEEMRQIIDCILPLEEKYHTKKTVITGDFNMNPYDDSCLDAAYFHAIPIHQEAMRKSRTVAKKVYEIFYNPMWNLLGDFTEPYGTYYNNTSDFVNPYWNVFDQVIIRPELKRYFLEKSLRILTATDNASLLDKNKHPDHSISDHLPITFEIKEEDHE